MKRRAVLKYVTLATGAAISAPLLTSILSGCQTDSVPNVKKYIPTFFTVAEHTIVKKLVDIILPKTDSLAASEVGVHNMIDHMVGNVYKNEDQAKYKLGLTTLCKHLAGTTEEDIPDYNKLLQMDEAATTSILEKLNSSTEAALEESKSAFLHLKQQAIAYYLSSEEIGTKYLNYLPIPGQYEACIQLKNVGGKAWAI